MNTVFTRASKTLAAAVAVGLLATASFAEPIKLRMGSATSDSDNDVYKIAYLELKKALEAAAPGEFDVSFFPNRQLGDEKEMMQGMQLGTLDMAIVTNSVIANVVPQFVVNDLPFLYADQDKAAKVLDSALGDDLLAELDSKGIVGLAYCESGYRHMLNNIRPVTSKEDVVGAKYRVMQSPIFIGMFENLGGNPVPMAWGDTITAFQQGAIDGLEVPAWVVAAANLDEIASYMSLTKHVYSVAPVMISKASYGRLSDSQKTALKAAAKSACGVQRTRSAGLEGEILDGLRAAGRIEINDVTEPAPFREAMQPVYEGYRDKIGSERLDAWLAALSD
ncbi:TRAP transporter substrate-binding protein DctP [Roseobacter sp. N2S]|uniref:TRAP transporter substrate-binding protein DctP n=1 Tax=Roseobacter sp. N2S TaxID=2663844 RepID=UPI00285EAFA6|nr:TRAP transporter substrate-binding protein DctP [Roseobacter sp. N2S]MDR6266956.1 tripartite ATP-independent transporter DctP family solute receptor [Roseobacter sp. N2S]